MPTFNNQNGFKLQTSVTGIQFDPEDELTKNLTPQDISYFIYQDQRLLGICTPSQQQDPSCTAVLTQEQMDDQNAVIRLIAKDTSQLQKQGVEIKESDYAPQVGTISLNIEYFKNITPAQHGQKFKQLITLFDDVDDDEFDGDLGEDDEELPMIQTTFVLSKNVPPVVPQEATPSPQRMNQAPVPQKNQEPPENMSRRGTSQGASSQAKSQIPSINRNMGSRQGADRSGSSTLMSPIRNPKRKTIVTESGTKKVVNLDADGVDPNAKISPRSPGNGKFASRRQSKKEKASDIFGDFFGFGPNPPGCMSKGAEPIDLKKEKEIFLGLLSNEAKRYDVQGMHVDLNAKLDQIVRSIKKEEKIIMNDEERQLRNLDKLEYMSQYLNEDHVQTQNSLKEASKIRDEAQQQMMNFDQKSKQEMADIEMQVRKMQEMIEQHEKQQSHLKSENLKLQKQIQDSRDKDVNQNQKLIDSIEQKDLEFNKLEKDLKGTSEIRQKNLAKYNQDCEQASMQTQKTENLLNEKENARQVVANEKLAQEKRLAGLNEKNLKEQSLNYQLSYRHKYLTQKSEMAEKKIQMLNEKLQYMTNSMTKQIRDQAEHANEVEVESKKLKAELDRQKDEVQLKQNELKKLDDSNAQVKKQDYDKQIEGLQRKLQTIETQRIKFQHQLEQTHVSWTCKLQLFVTDMNNQSEKTQNDLTQIMELLQSMSAVGEKQAGLLQQRQQLLQDNFEQSEKQELTNHLQAQIQDCDKMIEDADQQIKEIQEQVEKINAALQERQEVINDQIAELNVIRQKKITLDKQIQLQESQITDLKRHIERYDADIERLTQDKEVLIERLNDLSQSVAQKIDEIEEMELLIKDKDKIIDLMNKKIRDKQSRPVFQMPKGDLIDQMLGHYINQANCPVPIRKIGNGFYLFGTKKIFAKILNGKLVIRVGGGFMIIEEFIATYADAEMTKIQKMSEEQLMALGADSSEMTTSINPNARLSMYRAQTQKSPSNANVKGKVDTRLSGTNRVPQQAIMKKLNSQV